MQQDFGNLREEDNSGVMLASSPLMEDLLSMHRSREESNEPNRGQPEILMTRMHFAHMQMDRADRNLHLLQQKQRLSH